MQTGESTIDSKRVVVSTDENRNLLRAAKEFLEAIPDKTFIGAITYGDLEKFKKLTNITDEKTAKSYLDTLSSLYDQNREDYRSYKGKEDELINIILATAKAENHEELKNLNSKLGKFSDENNLRDRMKNGVVTNLSLGIYKGRSKVFKQKEEEEKKAKQEDAYVDEQASVRREALSATIKAWGGHGYLNEVGEENIDVDDFIQKVAEENSSGMFKQLKDEEGNETGLVQRNVFSMSGRVSLGNLYEIQEMLKASGANYNDEDTHNIYKSLVYGKLFGGESTQKVVRQLKKFMGTREGVHAIDTIRRGTEQAKQDSKDKHAKALSNSFNKDVESKTAEIAKERLYYLEENTERYKQLLPNFPRTTEEAIKDVEKYKGKTELESRIKGLEELSGVKSIISKMKEADVKRKEKQKKDSQPNDPSQTKNNTKNGDASPIPNDAKEVKLVLQIGDELVNAIAKIIKG